MTPSNIYSTSSVLQSGTMHLLLALSLACAIAGFLLVEQGAYERLLIFIGFAPSEGPRD